jgi:hypothetical protein
MKTSDLVIIEKIEEHLRLLEVKSLIPRKWLRIICITSLIFLFLGIFDSLVATIICLCLPLLWTVLSLYKDENKNHWIIYWVVYALTYLLDIINIKYFIPFYYLIKCLILIYLYFPNSKGTQLIERFVLPKVANALKFNKSGGLKKEIDSLLIKKC